MDFLFSVIAFIVLVGVLVAIHEYGHYIAAKLCVKFFVIQLVLEKF